ncbi:squamosa promoter-binding-like protein 8 isoform X2 [Abrus precatorius]|uniref:Squamosa promoter-binding-like protein 8 isoform X2 n=1 Tax=Abrus precatorius TaxID=3816 RepID=A0A8B8JXM4_ABRPR|nr:squamosa promoter-binding-like protein 8 isoform X2 [Abrus precatorius]
MLDYEWGNPSTIILAGNEGAAATDTDQTHRQIFDHNYTSLSNPFLHGSTLTATPFSHHHHFNPPQPHQHQHHPFFDPRAFSGASATSFSPSPSMLSLNPIPPISASHCGLGPGSGLGLLLMPKSEDFTPPVDFQASGLGLNLGGRTYFASCNDDIVNRLCRRAKTVESVPTMLSNLPRCQAQGCNADLSDAKHYHRRHKVCEFHSKAATVVAAGLTQRFCQQCSRFHLLSEFDNGKRSCRKRLADHNRRRRKIQQPTQEIQKSQPPLDNIARSSSESGIQSSSSVKVGLSPPDYFRRSPYQNRGSSTSSSGSLLFSSG